MKTPPAPAVPVVVDHSTADEILHVCPWCDGAAELTEFLASRGKMVSHVTCPRCARELDELERG